MKGPTHAATIIVIVSFGFHYCNFHCIETAVSLINSDFTS